MSAKPSPAFSVALLGEVLVDCFPDGCLPGGAPLNVARHLRAFGLDPLLLTRVGDDEAGEQILASLQRWRLDTRGVQRDGVHPTGRALVHTDRDRGGNLFEIVPNSAYDFVDAAAATELFRDVRPELLYFGTLGQRRPASRRALAALLERFRGTRFFDVNLRAPWFNARRLDDLLGEADILKLNALELEVLAGFLGLPEDDTARAAALMVRYSLREVVVTNGPDGAFRVGPEGAVLRARSLPPGPGIVDTVGAGDGFAAVLILSSACAWPPAVGLARAGSFAHALCQIRGAIPEEARFYHPFLAEWGITGDSSCERTEPLHLGAS